MRYYCNKCGKTFSTDAQAKCCPYCMNTDIEPTGKASALKMLEKYNELDAAMNELIDQYIPLYLEAETIRATLRTYKARGIISEAEMPKKVRPQIQARLSEYRKNRKES